MIGSARKPETPNPETTTAKAAAPPALLPQDPTVCQTLPGDTAPVPFQDHHASPPKGKNAGVRTNNRPVPPGTYSLIFHP
jgi:hypothetical protein